MWEVCDMVNMTLAIPEELKEMMDKHAEINWSEVARQAFIEKTSQLELFESIASKSRLTEKDAEEIARKIKKSMWKKHKSELA